MDKKKLCKKKLGLKKKCELLKRKPLIYLCFSFSFCSCIPHNKDNLHKKQIEKDIVLFIVKEVVPFSFVKTSLILRQNFQLIFHPSKSLNMIFCLRLL
jgi:hypothetical protein